VNIGWAFHSAALRYPELTALDDGQRRLTYRDWYERAAGVAGALRRRGVRPGDRVAAAMRQSEGVATLYMAIQLAGAVAVPISFRFGPRELGHCLRDSGARLLFADESVLGAVGELDEVPDAIDSAEIDELAGGDSLDAADANDDSGLSVILYTSGTTGTPKGVPRTHRAEHAASAAHVIQCRYALGESTLGLQTVAHTMGIRSLLSMVLVNGKYVPAPSLTEGDALGLLARLQVSALYLVPTAFHILLGQMEAGPVRLPACRKIAYAGAPMTASLVERCVAAFEPEVFVNHYGSTEIYTFTVSPDQRHKPGCAGRPGLHSRIRVVTASRERPVPPGETVGCGELGEIIASMDGDEAFNGYLNRPEATESAIRESWYYTGDLGRLDADGDLWVEGRVDDMVITGGENVYPLEVEDVVSRHPKVAEAVVCGLPDEKWGQVVAAFVVARPGVELEASEIDVFVRASDLARYKRPRRVIVVSEIPKSPVGKILRRLLIAGQYEAVGS
jgi:2-furoate---CoA ligase